MAKGSTPGIETAVFGQHHCRCCGTEMQKPYAGKSGKFWQEAGSISERHAASFATIPATGTL